MHKRRDAILNAAIELFSKRPYHMVIMDDIAKKARVAKGTLYYHYKSKEDLYSALLHEGLDTLFAKLKEEAKGKSTVESLRIFITQLVSFFYERRDFFEVLKREEGKLLSKKVKNCYERICSIKELLYVILSRGVAEGQFRNDLDVDTVVEILIGMIKSSVTAEVEVAALSDTLFGLLFNGIRGECVYKPVRGVPSSRAGITPG